MPHRPRDACVFAALLFTLLVGLGGCSLFDNPSNTSPSVYVAGSYSDGSKGYASYWKEGVEHKLPGDGISGHNEIVTAITVVDGVVYAAGYRSYGSVSIACYWADGVEHDLPDDGNHEDAQANSIFVADGTVYVAGDYYTGSTYVPWYWANGTKTELVGDGTHSAFANAVFASQGHVYVAGYYEETTAPNEVACYWKDGVTVDLPGDGTDGAEARAIYVSGSTVYTAGYYNYNDQIDESTRYPSYWINRSLHRLPTGGELNGDASANAIVVVDGTVYAAGRYTEGSKYYAVTWKGNQQTYLHGDDDFFTRDADAVSIAVSSGTVYAAGEYSNGSTYVPSYWVDGKRIDLPDPGTAPVGVTVTGIALD